MPLCNATTLSSEKENVQHRKTLMILNFFMFPASKHERLEIILSRRQIVYELRCSERNVAMLKYKLQTKHSNAARDSPRSLNAHMRADVRSSPIQSATMISFR